MTGAIPAEGGPKVALCGNIANNAYNMACILRRQGVFAQLEDDGSDLFPFSRPVWEDRPLVLSYEDVMLHSWHTDEWRRLEAQEGWSAGGVVIPSPKRSFWRRCTDQLRRSSPAVRIKTAVRQGHLSHAAARLLLRHGASVRDSIAWLSKFDLVIAFGFHAAVKAYFADKTTLYVTYGGDVRVQLQDPQGTAPDTAEAMAFLLNSDRFVIEGYGCDKEIHDVLAAKHLLHKLAYGFLPNVNTKRLAAPRDAVELRRSLDWPTDELVFFMASRIEEKWKKSSLFIDAFSDFIRQGGKATLVTTGWGADFDALRHRLSGDPLLASKVILLDKCYGKPRLFDLFAAADIIVDQFAVGSLGSVSFEALCLGRPVLTYLAPFNLAGYVSPPPILNAGTRADILHRLQECADCPKRLEPIGRASADWFQRVYAEANLAQAVRLLHESGPEAWPTFHKVPAAPAALPVPEHRADVFLSPRPDHDDLRRLRLDIAASAHGGIRLRIYPFSGVLREEELAGLSVILRGDFVLSGIDLLAEDGWQESVLWRQSRIECTESLSASLPAVPVNDLERLTAPSPFPCRLIQWPKTGYPKSKAPAACQ
ncbi:hypothetical protein ACCD06_27885 [Azospirillum sp. CT11-132]|uniref:hypothetical protein n=1 Tax=Azospirillum sp. CT11-132 TaxID=3396317 RepID=UPI0039A68C14